MKRFKYLLVPLAFVLTVAMTSAVTMAVGQLYPAVRIGAYWTTNIAFDSTNVGAVGGQVLPYLSGDSSWIGDVVYISAKNTIKHDTILTNYNNVAGVVVGGTRTSMQATADSGSVGSLAATNGQRVLVLTKGRAWVTLDTQPGAPPGTLMFPSNRQGQRGRVVKRTTAIDTFYRALGRIVDTGVLGTKRLINVSIK
jgi:hypothetical protein